MGGVSRKVTETWRRESKGSTAVMLYLLLFFWKKEENWRNSQKPAQKECSFIYGVSSNNKATNEWYGYISL